MITKKMETKIYISLTSIFSRQQYLLVTLKSIIKQSFKVDKIYLYLSEKEYLLDEGFKNKVITNQELSNFLKNNNQFLEIKWVENIGPYRKIIPLLKEKWNEYCTIIILDDDMIYPEDLIEKMINFHKTNKNVAIANRIWSMNIKNKLSDWNYQDVLPSQLGSSKYNFFTGCGGVLIPPFFYKGIEHLLFDENMFKECCPTADDIWLNIMRILNNKDCFNTELYHGIFFQYNFPGGSVTSTNSLYNIYNGPHLTENNNIHLRKIFLKLKKMGYDI